MGLEKCMFDTILAIQRVKDKGSEGSCMFDTILAIQRGQGQGLRDWVR